MKLAEWMREQSLDDDAVAAMVDADRVTVSRVRRGVNKPSWLLAARLKAASGGRVTADDFLPDLPEVIPQAEVSA